MSERLSQIADKYEELVSKGLEFHEVDHDTLDPSTNRYLRLLDDTGLRYLIATVRIDRTVLFKIDHPWIAYLHHDPVEMVHMWADVGFQSALNNTRVLATLAELAGILLPSSHLLKLFGVEDGEE